MLKQAAKNMVLRQQLISLSRQHKRSPKLNTLDRIMFGMLARWINPRRLSRIAITLKPATILKFHRGGVTMSPINVTSFSSL